MKKQLLCANPYCFHELFICGCYFVMNSMTSGLTATERLVRITS